MHVLSIHLLNFDKYRYVCNMQTYCYHHPRKFHHIPSQISTPLVLGVRTSTCGFPRNTFQPMTPSGARTSRYAHQDGEDTASSGPCWRHHHYCRSLKLPHWVFSPRVTLPVHAATGVVLLWSRMSHPPRRPQGNVAHLRYFFNTSPWLGVWAPPTDLDYWMTEEETLVLSNDPCDGFP